MEIKDSACKNKEIKTTQNSNLARMTFKMTPNVAMTEMTTTPSVSPTSSKKVRDKSATALTTIKVYSASNQTFQTNPTKSSNRSARSATTQSNTPSTRPCSARIGPNIPTIPRRSPADTQVKKA